MKKILSLLTLLLVVTIYSHVTAQVDSLANYEPGSNLVYRNYSWTATDIAIADNPVSDAVNSSSKALQFTRSSQYGSAVGFNNFDNSNKPISLYQFPIIKLKALSETTVDKVIRVQAIDINGYSVSVENTMPSSANVWADFSFDFTSKLTTTPISFIKEIVVFINSGDATTGEVYYLDDILFSGPEASSITEATILTLFQEQFSDNAWWLPDHGSGTYYKDSTFVYFRTAQYGGSALTGSAEHYNANDSLRMIMTNWAGTAWSQLFPVATRPGESAINLINFSIKGLDNLTLSYDLQWVDVPTSYSNAITVEYQLDGGAWTELTTSSTLPSGTGTWTTDIIYDIPSLSGDTVNFRLTNNESANLYVDNISFKGTKVFATGITISAPDTIIHTGSSIQFTDVVTPSNANQAAYWYISAGDSAASIDPITGLLTTTGGQYGVATVKAIAKDITGKAVDSKVIYIYHPVDSINVRSEDDVTVLLKGVTGQMIADVYPLDSTNNAVEWSSSDDAVATISSEGLVTAVSDGTAWIKAVAVDGGEKDSLEITVTSNKTWSEFAIANLIVGSVDNATDYSGSLQMSWDADSVYMIYNVADDSITIPFEGQWGPNNYACDNIEIYFDMDNSKNNHWPRNGDWIADDPTFDTNDYQLRLNPNYSPLFSGADTNFVNVQYELTDTGYNFYLNIPWDSLMEGFNAVAGTKIGFDVLLSDNDIAESESDRNQITYNSITDKAFNDPSLWATLQLVADGSFKAIADTDAPTTPANVVATATDADVDLTWDASTDNRVVQEYIILQGTTALDTILAKKTDNSYTIADLAEGTYTFSVIAVDLYGNESGEGSSNAVDIVLEGVSNPVAQVNIYPNPVESVLNIRSNEKIEFVTIINVAGKVERAVNVNSLTAYIDFNGLSRGIYIVKIQTATGINIQRIIKK